MDAVSVIRRLHQHRIWTTKKLLAMAATLNDEQLRRGFAIGQGSIWKSLVHLFGAEYVWLDAMLGNEDGVAPGDARGKLPGNQEGENPFAALADLVTAWTTLDSRWEKYLGQLTNESLDETVFRKSSTTGVRAATMRSDILLHICTHAQYTTAQIINMFRQAGVAQLPDPMLISMARETVA